MFSEYKILNTRHPSRAFIFGLLILDFVWHLNLALLAIEFSRNQNEHARYLVIRSEAKYIMLNVIALIATKDLREKN